MLKLLKYEWKACARACLPLYGAIILVALINHLLYSEAVPELLFGIPAAIMSMLYVVIFAAVFVATAVILVQRFYKSLLGGEGYLMFTLPVSVTQHIFSKAIIAVAMCFLSCLVAFLSILLLSHGINPATFSFLDPAAVPYVLEGLLWLVLCAFAADAVRVASRLCCSFICASRSATSRKSTVCSWRSCGTLCSRLRCRSSACSC